MVSVLAFPIELREYMHLFTGDDVERGPGDDPCAPADPAQPGLPRPARQLRQPHTQEACLDMMRMSYPCRYLLYSAYSGLDMPENELYNPAVEDLDSDYQSTEEEPNENENGALTGKRDIHACYF